MKPLTTITVILFSFISSFAQINSTSFATKVDFSIGTNTAVGLGTIADLNNDNKPEVVVTYNSNSTTGQIAILPNNTSQGSINLSSFGSVITLPAISGVLQLDAADLDGDGKADIVASPYTNTNTATSFSVYRNTSVGNSISFSIPSHIALTSCMSPIKLKDMDGDGKADLIAGFWYLGQVRVYRNTSTLGNISFDISGATIINAGNQPISLLCNDFSGDGITDIAICNFSSNNIMVFKNTSSLGNFNFTSPVITILTGSLPSRIVAADMDNDMKMDILVSNYNSGNIGIYKNTSSLNNLSFSTATTFSSLTNPLQAGCADFDADGKQDVVVSYESSSTISVWRNFGSSSTINSNTLGNRREFTNGGSVSESYVADIDGDNKIDIVTVNRSNGIISVLKNQTKPSNGLIAYYPFNGNAGDSSGFENHGTSFSGVSNTTNRKSEVNQAFAFNGSSNAYVNVPASISLNTANLNDITILWWFKPNILSTSIHRRLFNIQSSTSVNYDLSYDYSTKKLVYINWNGLSASSQFFSTDTFSFNTWHYAAVVIDSTNTTRLYVNGVLQGTSTNTIIKPINPTLSIGRHLTANWNFNGAIDEFRMYNRALTQAEIIQLGQDNPVYYSKSTGNLNNLSTWGTNTDGSGTAPLSFDSSNVTYRVVNNTSPTLGGNLRVNGANSALVFGDGTNAFNLVIGANDTLSCDSMYVQNNITLTNSGTLHCTKLGANNNSNVQYIRATPQSLAAGSYGNLVISSSTKTLTGNTSIKGNFGMLASVNCNGFNLTLGSSAASTGVLNRSAGTIIGSFTRWFNNATNTGTTGLFPVGTATKYTPYQIEFTSAPNTGGTITCEFITGNPGNIGLPQFDFTTGAVFIDKSAQDGIWRLSGSGVAGGTFNATVTANNFAGVNNYADLRIIRRAQAGSWALQGNATVNAGSNTAAVVGRIGLTTIYGEYGIGGDQSVNPLPVKLVSFTANLIDNEQSLLQWSTSQEFNADKFIIQRSSDQMNWFDRGIVKAKGFSTSLVKYAFTDAIEQSFDVLYYRLVEVDLNGKKTSSKTISVIADKLPDFSVFPNPTQRNVYLQGVSPEGATIYDITGIPVLSTTKDGWLTIEQLKPGIYFVKSAQKTIRLVKE